MLCRVFADIANTDGRINLKPIFLNLGASTGSIEHPQVTRSPLDKEFEYFGKKGRGPAHPDGAQKCCAMVKYLPMGLRQLPSHFPSNPHHLQVAITNHPHYQGFFSGFSPIISPTIVQKSRWKVTLGATFLG